METQTTGLRSSVGPSSESLRAGEEQSKWSQGLQSVQQSAKDAAQASEEFVKTHPFYTVLGAATVGFVAGILMGRNKH